MTTDEWWCVPTYSRSQRKRKNLKKNPPPYRSSREECAHLWGEYEAKQNRCGYRDRLGRIVPWEYDSKNPHRKIKDMAKAAEEAARKIDEFNQALRSIGP